MSDPDSCYDLEHRNEKIQYDDHQIFIWPSAKQSVRRSAGCRQGTCKGMPPGSPGFHPALPRLKDNPGHRVRCTHPQDCAQAALADAEVVCLARGARLTPIRRAVLTEIWANHEATKAYDLIERLSSGGNLIKPPTVYRALDFLLAHGLIHRIESLNAFIGCHHPTTHHQAILMICDRCGTINEAASEALNGILGSLTRAEHFQVSHQSIELHGLCAACQ